MADDRRQPYQGASPRSGSERRQSGYVQDKRGLNTKIHLAVDAHGMPIRLLVTEGTRADCKEAVHLIEGISAETLLADRGYDTNDILAYAVSAGMEPVIPPKKNRKEQRDYETLERHCHPLCQDLRCFYRCSTCSLYRHLGCHTRVTRVDTI